jgi:hypothetical protein
MKHLICNRTAGTIDRTQGETAADLDDFFVDVAFDDFLDRELFAIRELADFRNL